MSLGKKIYQLRKEQGVSQEELASQLNVSRQSISKWELEESMPDTENIIQLSRLFCVSTDYLLLEESKYDTDIPAEKVNSGKLKAEHKSKIFGYLGVALYILGSVWYIVSRMIVHGEFIGFSLLWLNLHDTLTAMLIPIAVILTFFFLLKRFPAATHANVPKLNFMLSIFLVLIPIATAAVIPYKIYYIPCLLVVALIAPVILYSSSVYYKSAVAPKILIFINRWLQLIARIFAIIIICTFLSALVYFVFFNLHPMKPALYLLLNCLPYLPFTIYAYVKSKQVCSRNVSGQEKAK